MSKTEKNQEFDYVVMQANFSALLYVLTEQQALIGRLFKELLDSGYLAPQQIEKITDLRGDLTSLNEVYADLYRRFAHYYLRIKGWMESTEEDLEKPAEDDDGKEKDDGGPSTDD